MNTSCKLFNLKVAKNWKIVDHSATNIYLFSFKDGKTKKVLSSNTSTEGSVKSAVISYDFSKIAYGLTDKNASYIYIIDTDGLNKIKLLQLYSLEDINSLAWSCDGNKIVFVGKIQRKDESEFNKDDPSTWLPRHNSLYLYDSVTGKIELLVDEGVSQISGQCWSPVNSELLYEDTQGNLNIFNLKTNSHKLFIEKASYATWSPTGEWIAYKDDKKEAYFIIKPDKSQKKKIISKPHFFEIIRLVRNVIGALTWSPDGQFVYYVRNTGLSLDAEIPKPFIMEIANGKESSIEMK